jgi:hypothetical protein
MQFLTDCEILEYCHSNPEEREAAFQRAVDNQAKPIYQLHMFELFHASHIMIKHYGKSPKDFRKGWWEFCEKHIASGEFFIHVADEDPLDNLKGILSVPFAVPEELPTRCEEESVYWCNKSFIYRLQSVREFNYTSSLNDELSYWNATPPEGKEQSPKPEDRCSEDIVIDTNILIDLLNELPEDGNLSTAEIQLPDTISEAVRKKISHSIKTYGSAGKIIIPDCVLEEAYRVSNYNSNKEKYKTVSRVLKAMLINEKPLWNVFQIEVMNQELFDYFVFLYEEMESTGVDLATFDDFADLIVLAHGLYHGCKIASDEWIHVKKGPWQVTAPMYSFLVIK